METKKIIESLRYCVEQKTCVSCPSGGYKNSYVNCKVAKEAADSLELLKADLCHFREVISVLKKQLSEKQPEWISVEDRLPEKNGRYLVYNQKIIYITYYEAGKFFFNDITHWMPLLEPPKQKEPTFNDIFLKAFPGAVVLPKSGVPVVCAKQVFPQLGDDESTCDMCCAECWNRSYFEEEGEAECD